MPPIVHVQQNCNGSVSIPGKMTISSYLFPIHVTIRAVFDVDGDDVRCRWASSLREECGGVCQAFPATLDGVSPLTFWRSVHDS